MSALALIARDAGYTVTGNDAHCYPPVSDLLIAKGIEWIEGYEDARSALQADLIIVGNAIKRGMPVLEAILDAGIPYTSGPQWLAEHVLKNYQVIAVAGTHGKTTTTSMIAWILECAGFDPGFLIGGVATNFATSARLGKGKWFVIEADEYDSAFFDKRPKFMHYRPNIAVLNNLEFDHADIYHDLAAIQQQFHYLLRTIPKNGTVIKPRHDKALTEVLAEGCYSTLEDTAINDLADWRAELLHTSGSSFKIIHKGYEVATIEWSLIGLFNVENALSACAACVRAGVSIEAVAFALARFQPVKRRLEVKAHYHNVTVYDDFAHHPTAIAKTIDALKTSGRHRRILVIMEFASYTMRMGVHIPVMAQALHAADQVFFLHSHGFDLSPIVNALQGAYHICADNDEIVGAVMSSFKPGDALLIMSNKSFNGLHEQIIAALKQHQQPAPQSVIE